jgi:hypothetical protein
LRFFVKNINLQTVFILMFYKMAFIKKNKNLH